MSCSRRPVVTAARGGRSNGGAQRPPARAGRHAAQTPPQGGRRRRRQEPTRQPRQRLRAAARRPPVRATGAGSYRGGLGWAGPGERSGCPPRLEVAGPGCLPRTLCALGGSELCLLPVCCAGWGGVTPGHLSAAGCCLVALFAPVRCTESPLVMPFAFPRLEIGEADFVLLCDALKVSDSVREKAWKTYESLSAVDGALVSTCCF